VSSVAVEGRRNAPDLSAGVISALTKQERGLGVLRDIWFSLNYFWVAYLQSQFSESGRISDEVPSKQLLILRATEEHNFTGFHFH